jgi:preprotein translocase subunit SecD
VIDEVAQLAGATGRVDFVPLGQASAQPGQQVDSTEFPPLFPATEVADATIGSDQNGLRTVDLTLRSQGTALLARYTAEHVGESMAIVLDGQVVSSFVVMEPIVDGRLQISVAGDGGSQLAEAQALVTTLKFGQLPFPMQELSVERR